MGYCGPGTPRLIASKVRPEMRMTNGPFILPRPLLALLCSNRCPGNLVLLFYELARRLRDERIATIGGFQTPMELEALDFLIRGRQPVIWVPSWSRSEKGLKATQRQALSERGLVLLNVLDPPVRRPSRGSGERRNRWIVENSDAVLLVHANPGGLTEVTGQRAHQVGKPVWTLADPANAHLAPIEHLTVDDIVVRMRALAREEGS